ncbi:protein FAR-RED IMPAIRED RESPONSE 1-like [Olea europaea var. sylvestris]|uniref:protein FAR-RED IMPAIRED RESPONSE 1-like n=1 Tax=Olea europaea var. sylvestris TaxID=158386 RepID=UPI000C1CE2F0|nr:protein FAR-RED IMPAIRED RESPONSE 1-like [Olea europaea var. sylvestris]
MKLGCKARISASCDVLGNWRINVVNLEHNHDTSPSKSRLYRCSRQLSAAMKRKLQVNDLVGIALHKSYNSAVVEAGGYENVSCIEKDCRNYVERMRRLRLREGDAVAIQSYFSKMQAQCSEFYFDIDLDKESLLRNVFWADNQFEIYDFLFIVVIKNYQKRCGLEVISDLEEYWLPIGACEKSACLDLRPQPRPLILKCPTGRESFLQCMHGQAPHGIITDQDRTMQNTIHIVFPNTKHRWYLWHILKKLPEKFGYHVDKHLIFGPLHRLVYDSQSGDEFENGWGTMIDMYGLHENDWLLDCTKIEDVGFPAS